MSTSEVRIDRSVLVNNFNRLARRFGGRSSLVPVVKANAYGHGMELVVRTIAPLKPRAFAVAHAWEAIALRQYYRGRILVLSAWEQKELIAAIRKKVELVVWDAASTRMVSRAARRARSIALVHAKIDSGTGRLGERTVRALPFLQQLLGDPSIVLRGVFTHFSDAEDEEDGYTELQLQRFLQCTRPLPGSIERHAACTAARLRFPNTQLSFSRVGIGLYGYWPSLRTQIEGFPIVLKPALTWRSRILQMKQVPRGAPIGYGRTFSTKRRSSLAIVPVGYADGYPRSLSNKGFVQLSTHRCRVLGRISMNLIVIDVTSVLSARPGDWVYLIGGEGRGAVLADELAATADTIHYELLSRIADHIPRLPHPTR